MLTRRVIPIVKDGNCLFRAISYCLYGSQMQHPGIRQQVVSKILQEWSSYKNFIIGDRSYRLPINSNFEYRDLMSNDGEYAGHVELHCAATLFPHYAFKVHRMESTLSLCFGSGSKICHLQFSGHQDSGHYDVLEFLNSINSEISIYKPVLANENVRGKFIFNDGNVHFSPESNLSATSLAPALSKSPLLSNLAVHSPKRSTFYQWDQHIEEKRNKCSMNDGIAEERSARKEAGKQRIEEEWILKRDEIKRKKRERMMQSRSQEDSEQRRKRLGENRRRMASKRANEAVEEKRKKNEEKEKKLEKEMEKREEQQRRNEEKRRLAEEKRQKREEQKEEKEKKEEEQKKKKEDEKKKKEEEKKKKKECEMNKKKEEKKKKEDEKKKKEEEKKQKKEEEKEKKEDEKKKKEEEKKQKKEEEKEKKEDEKKKKEEEEKQKKEEEKEKKGEEEQKRKEEEKKRKEEDKKRKEEEKNKKKEEEKKRKEEEKKRQEEEKKRQEEEKKRQEEEKKRQEKENRKKMSYLGENVPDNVSPLLIGVPSISCKHCGALSFKLETGRSKNSCCHNGKIKLNPLPPFPDSLLELFCGRNGEALHFRKNIRFYNNSFAMASFCPAEDASLRGVGCLRIRGEVNVRATTSLIPTEGQQPSLAQIYIYDNETALTFRTSDQCRETIVKIIQEVMSENPYARIYKTLFQLYQEKQCDPEVSLQFLRLKQDDRRRYNHPNNGVAEVAAIVFTGVEGLIPTAVDFVAYPKHQFESKIIHKLSGHNEPMTFPLFFPRGTPGYSIDMLNENLENQRRITAAQYFGQRLSIHANVFNPILQGARLTQQYIIYGYIVIEWNRLNFIKTNQQLFRRETFQGLADHIQNSAANTSDKTRLGHAMILPSSFDGGPRAMQQLYQDSMAMTRELGRPDLFITYTANPQWPEIKEYLKTMPPGTTASDIPTFVVRAFNIRLMCFISDVCSGRVFGTVLGYVYTVEFQKRGLPHAHCIFILHPRNKLLSPEAIDRFICAEIPDKNLYPELYKKVMKHMLHGPHQDSSPCWNATTGKCSKKFPHAFITATDMTKDSFPKYRRRDNRADLHIYNSRVHGIPVPVDNSMVVPYNPYLLLKYDCHINVEYCGTLGAFKYIHKYITKGHDRIRVRVTNFEAAEASVERDEIGEYIDSRYISSMEAAWRILGLPMHGHSHAVYRLPVHLPGQQYVSFVEGRESEAVSEKRSVTKLTAYFQLNQMHPKARELHYWEIPKFFVWNDSGKSWNERSRDHRIIVRLYSVSPKDSERFFLKVLLRNTKGALCFEDLRTYEGIVYNTFKEAAYARGFGIDENDAVEVMTEASSVMMPHCFRAFFSYLLLTCDHIDGKAIWEKFKDLLCEGTDERRALSDIEHRMNGEDRSLADFGIEIIDCVTDSFNDGLDSNEHQALSLQMIGQLNDEQKEIFSEISAAIADTNPRRKLFFIDGPGGTGKTFLYKTLYHYQKHLQKKIVCVAWTGIAAILLPSGKTAHRIFKLPLQMSSEDTIKPAHLTKKAKQILTDIDFVIWDEASMIPSIALSIVDVTLRDVMKTEEPFGGKYVLLGGDFRQVLPIVKKGSRYQIIQSTLISSALWPLFKIFHLQKNMRANDEFFSKWLLKIGDGDIDPLTVPPNMLCSDDIISSIYSEGFAEDYLHSGRWRRH